MDHETISQSARSLYDLMGTQLRVRGRDLATRLKKSQRMMPRYVRREIHFLVEAEKIAQNPKLVRMVDPAKVRKAEKVAREWLNAQDPGKPRRDYAWSVAGSVGLAVLVTGGLLIAALVWLDLV